MSRCVALLSGLLLAGLFVTACTGSGPPAAETPTSTATPAQVIASPSPTGTLQLLAYLGADGAVYRIKSDGSGRKKLIEEGRCPPAVLVWSSEGDRLACVGGDSNTGLLVPGPRPLPSGVVGGFSGHALVVDSEGRILTEITPVRSFAWSPAGLHIAYTFLSASEPALEGILVVADADGAEVAMFDSVALGSGSSVPDFAWSPDGQEIAFARERALVIYDLAAGEERAVGEGLRPLAWALEEQAMLVAANYQPPREAPDTAFGLCPLDCYEANLLDLASGHLARVPELDDGSQFWLSRDGGRAIILGWRGQRLELRVLDLATLSITPIKGSGTSYPSHSIPFSYVAFSPDSSEVYWLDPENEGIYKAKTDGTGLTKVITLLALLVDFSPDLRKVAYVGPGRGEAPHLWIADTVNSSTIDIGPTGISTIDTLVGWRATP